MAGVLIATVLAIVALIWIALYIVREQARRHVAASDELHDARTPTLEYEVPAGVDVAVVLAAVEQAGYTATVETLHGDRTLLVKCPQGIEAERDRIRSVIENAGSASFDHQVPTPTDVHFRDEI